MWLKDLFFDQKNLSFFINNCQIPNLHLLSDMFCSSKIRPDIAIYLNAYQKSKLILSMEIQSSPMVRTLRKATYLAANLLRFERFADDNITEYSVFAIPSIDLYSCIVEVNVKWEQLQFHVTLILYTDIQHGKEAMKKVLIRQIKNAPFLPLFKYYKYPLPMNYKDFHELGFPNAMQLHTTQHLVFESGNEIYKLIYNLNEQFVYTHLVSQIPLTAKLVIKPQLHELKLRTYIYKYQKVKYSSLDIKRAQYCIKDLLRSTKHALDELHSYGLSHNDVRLPNICFNEQFQAVLIDMDRLCSIECLHVLFGESNSCLYQIENLQNKEAVTGKQTDLMQLGWMAALILDHTQDEHIRVWEEQNDEIQNCKFIHKLVHCGEWDQVYFAESEIQGMSIQQALIPHN